MNCLRHFLSLALFTLGTASQAILRFGGELRYEHVEGLTYRVQGVLYTNLASPVDPPEIVIYFGGVADTVPRTGITDLPIPSLCGAVRVSIYETLHTFSGPGVYNMSIEGPSRGSGIVNVPNSMLQPFCVTAVLVINPLSAFNHSPQFTIPASVTDMPWSTLSHDPGAMDPDGDSLSFDLVTPNGFDCEPILGYSFPSSLVPEGWAWLDPATGVYLWHMPFIGEFTIAIRATQWRKGIMLGQVTRDMTFCSTAATAVLAISDGNEEVNAFLTNDEWILENNTQGILLGELIDARGAIMRYFNLPSGRTIIANEDLPNGLTLLRTTNAEGRHRTFKLTP